jgi:hypothetical protein
MSVSSEFGGLQRRKDAQGMAKICVQILQLDNPHPFVGDGLNQKQCKG